MAILTRTVFAAVVVFASGCQRSPTLIDVPTGSISVHAVLDAGSDSTTVLVTRAGRQFDAQQDPVSEPVTNAHVRLVHGADTITAVTGARACLRTFSSQPGDEVMSAGCYVARVPGGIRAGVTYDLLVDIAGEPSIRGTTRVPVPPQVIEPSESADPPVLHMQYPFGSPTALSARWSSTDATARTELRFITERSDCLAIISQPDIIYGLDYITATGADTATVTVQDVQCGQATTDQFAARFVVTVYDESYTRYTGGRTSITSAGISGALGVYGAAASSAVPVVLSKQ